jgi:uncharacterized protein (TIGR02172 family)
MALVTERIEDNVLYLELNGRIDSSNADQAEALINEIKQAHPDLHAILDAEKLEYLSSAGLRVVLRMRKDTADLKIINVSTEVYEILDMTGFTDMITVEKAFRRLSLEGCELLAKGANGAVYRYDPETIVKIYHNGASLDEIRLEKDLCRKVFIKGINTAIPYDVVKVDDYYGSVAELLSAKSIAKLLQANPEQLEEIVAVYTDLLKKIHATPVLPGEMPAIKATAVDWAEFLQPYLPAEQWEKLLTMMKAIPEPDFMIHGDYHANNVMIQDGEPLLIDMDTVAYGHPIFDFAAIYLGFVGYCECNHAGTLDFYGLPYEITTKIWETLMKQYFPDEAMRADVARKAQIIGYARMMRRTIRRNGLNTPDGQELIALCKQRLDELLPLVEQLHY